ncbi:MAG: ORC1-type DNA replication protein [Candidatus Nanohaloarchaea archaeon]
MADDEGGKVSVAGAGLKSKFSNYIHQDTVFRNKEALTTNWKPENILHRDQQINDLASILAPALKGDDPSNVFIYGSVGTGKTLITKHVTEELRTVAHEEEVDLNIVYINCKMKKVADTEYRLLAKLTRQLGEEVPSTGLPTDEVYSRFFDVLQDQEGVVIIALDEIDALVKKVGDEFLYNLTRINDDLEQTKVSILGISNDLNFTEYMDSRVKSSLSEEEIIFPPYDALELREILKSRADTGFAEEALEDGVISKCSALAAQEHGDARRALDLIRVAGELAERSEQESVTKSHVDRAQDKIERDRIVETVRSQPKHSKLVLYTILEIAEEEEEVATGDVYSKYKEICGEIDVSELTQRRVSGLISELDMLGVINGKVISKGRHGRTRQISVDLSEDIRARLREMVEDKFYI